LIGRVSVIRQKRRFVEGFLARGEVLNLPRSKVPGRSMEKLSMIARINSQTARTGVLLTLIQYPIQ
jgi:hypothetical protein